MEQDATMRSLCQLKYAAVRQAFGVAQVDCAQAEYEAECLQKGVSGESSFMHTECNADDMCR